MPLPVLTINGLAMSFGASEVLKNVSFSVAPGETMGLFGKSGSGKTTIGRCIVWLEKPTGGEILVHGMDILSMRKKRSFGNCARKSR